MTFILGARAKDGVALVADRRVTINGGQDYDECDKLFGEIGHVVYGSSGDSGMFELFRGSVMDYIATHPNEVKYQNVVLTLSQLVFQISKKYDFQDSFFYDVLVATQPPDKQSTLNLIQYMGTPYTIKNYYATGSGAPYAQVFLKKYWNDNMTMEQVGELGYFIIKYIEHFKLNFTVGGEPTIWFIPDNEKENDEKVNYKINEKRPELFTLIEKNAFERLRKHEEQLDGLFQFNNSNSGPDS